MSIKQVIVKGEDECLNAVCHPVTKFDRRLHRLIADMKATLLEENGVGLAAPQIGTVRRIFIINNNGVLKEYINPEILETVGEQDCLEGCLSLPDVWGRVKRPAWVKIRAQDENGEFFEDSADGLIAECFMHENDHLNGVLFDSLVYEFVDEETVRQEQQKKKAKAKIK
ncbi:MAG: peptide deformylase [Clostridia bacterium]|nr:peptide deformylase [Clostridia bacterium]